MKFYLVIDGEKEPSVTVVCNKVTATVERIRELCNDAISDYEILYGYRNDEITPLTLSCISCFYTKDGKVFASMDGNEYATKLRIKDIMELVDDSFIKVNQGCVANVHYIQKFVASIGGALRVVFKSGYSDYVSRRELPNIKRRFGL